MGVKERLNPDERNFFSMVNQAVLTNPFSDERVEIDLKIAGLFPDVSSDERIDRTINEVQVRIQEFERQGKADINRFSGRDKILVENSFLFDFFHKFIDQFDKLILDQIEAGSTCVKVPFARKAFSVLEKRGFNTEDIRRYFSLSYQLRRAYYFIDHGLIGRSPCMRELRRKLWNNVFTHSIDLYNRYLWNRMEDFSTLILGETGTGKGTAAMAIGRSGFIPFDKKKGCFKESFTESFVSLNLSQFSENLIESELFGHMKGAFTGATGDFKGVFDRCSSFGAIFLDEIGEVSIPVQIKLLQVLQERDFSPVGSHEKHRFQGRVIAATNRSIYEIRKKGILRDDFYYRLSSDIITVPTLRLRIREDPGEMDDLLKHTVDRMLGKPSPELCKMIRKVIDKQLGRQYHWPGNVRELEQCVRRVLLDRTYAGEKKSVATDLRSKLMEGITSGDINIQSLVAGYCYLLYRRHGTFEEVARRTRLDRRTVKKYIMEWKD